jgi:hypothetical protein
MFICARRQRTLVVAASITMRSQAASSTPLVNYSKILALIFNNGWNLEIYKNTKNYKMIFRLVFLEYLMLRSPGKPCSC